MKINQTRNQILIATALILNFLALQFSGNGIYAFLCLILGIFLVINTFGE